MHKMFCSAVIKVMKVITPIKAISDLTLIIIIV